MSIQDQIEILSALKWLRDCGGKMALSNNPLGHRLIKKGWAKKGGIDHLGRRTLVITDKAPKPSRGVQVELNDLDPKWFRDLPAETDRAEKQGMALMNHVLRDAYSKGEATGDWIEFVHNVHAYVGNDRGGAILMSPSVWAYLHSTSPDCFAIRYSSYIRAGMVGIVRGTVVITSPVLSDESVSVYSHDFSHVTTFTYSSSIQTNPVSP